MQHPDAELRTMGQRPALGGRPRTSACSRSWTRSCPSCGCGGSRCRSSPPARAVSTRRARAHRRPPAPHAAPADSRSRRCI
eukprot:752141-Prymnesium_polylepis.1